MVCERCTAYVKGRCSLQNKKAVMCKRTKEEVIKTLELLKISKELDTLARDYILEKDVEIANEWWRKVREIEQ